MTAIIEGVNRKPPLNLFLKLARRKITSNNIRTTQDNEVRVIY